ncbi:hypothetical protein E2C01_101771 [Portunus trituberculatus]|uniref:Uncharacterized protein n=1 Tax=Portunus trituberculatus TaxID=210409 RepID=A0A5B7KGP9_PORTR|nr:hypothetical protein [Portunus trituberculatus]
MRKENYDREHAGQDRGGPPTLCPPPPGTIGRSVPFVPLPKGDSEAAGTKKRPHLVLFVWFKCPVLSLLLTPPHHHHYHHYHHYYHQLITRSSYQDNHHLITTRTTITTRLDILSLISTTTTTTTTLKLYTTTTTNPLVPHSPGGAMVPSDKAGPCYQFTVGGQDGSQASKRRLKTHFESRRSSYLIL